MEGINFKHRKIAELIRQRDSLQEQVHELEIKVQELENQNYILIQELKTKKRRRTEVERLMM
jgi:uncharacterized coiled-coil DUF342 family protein